MTTLLLAAALSLPTFWTVHIDTPRRNARAAFEQVGREEAATRGRLYAERGIELPAVVSFHAADGNYYSLRPKTSWSEIEAPSPLPDDFRKLLQQSTAPLSDRAHATLRAHHTEIWRLQNTLTHFSDRAAPKYVRIRTDAVKPGSDSSYEQEMKRICDDCEKHGIAVLAFWSAYGDGTYRYIFMSNEPIRVEHAPAGTASSREVDASVTNWIL